MSSFWVSEVSSSWVLRILSSYRHFRASPATALLAALLSLHWSCIEKESKEVVTKTMHGRRNRLKIDKLAVIKAISALLLRERRGQHYPPCFNTPCLVFMILLNSRHSFQSLQYCSCQYFHWHWQLSSAHVFRDNVLSSLIPWVGMEVNICCSNGGLSGKKRWSKVI